MRDPKVLVGILLSVLFGYFAVRGVDWAATLIALERTSVLALMVPTAWFSLFFILRAYRWQRFVQPLEILPIRPFFSATMIGFMANDVLPLRAGELVRAYALSHYDFRPLNDCLSHNRLRAGMGRYYYRAALSIGAPGF